MTLTEDQAAVVLRIRRSRQKDFASLVRLAGLDPKKDFRHANLRGVDFGISDLNGFDFSGADLRNADLRYASTDGANFADVQSAGTLWRDVRAVRSFDTADSRSPLSTSSTSSQGSSVQVFRSKALEVSIWIEERGRMTSSLSRNQSGADYCVQVASPRHVPVDVEIVSEITVGGDLVRFSGSERFSRWVCLLHLVRGRAASARQAVSVISSLRGTARFEVTEAIIKDLPWQQTERLVTNLALAIPVI